MGIHLWGHHNIYYEIAKNKNFNSKYGGLSKLIVEIKQFKEKCPDGDVIVSSETFCGALPGELEYILNEFRKVDKVNVIVYYRRQDKYLRSFWSMPIGSEHPTTQNSEMPFEKWAMECIDKNRYSLYYNRQVKKFEKLIEAQNIKLVVYDDIPRNIFFQVFLRTIGLENFDGISLPKRNYNATLVKAESNNLKIMELCKNKFHDSNLLLARKYLCREYLFDYDADF